MSHTPGPWRAIAQGGSSTVVASSMPSRNDRRSEVTYGYRDDGEYCIGYPFLYQSEFGKPDESTRMDFVCFSHADARLISAAPDFKSAARDMCAALSRLGDWDDGCLYINGVCAPELQGPFEALADALAKAEGKS